MGKHVVGKWGRGEGEERKSARQRKGGYASYLEGNKRPYGVQCWCYVCSRSGRNPYHRWEDGHESEAAA